MDATRATAAPSVVELSGKKYLISPLDDKRIGMFERFLQDRVVDIAKRNSEGLPPERADAMLAHAIDKASRLQIGSIDSLPMIGSIEVLVYLFWLSINKAHPEVTLEIAYELMLDPANMERAMGTVNNLQGKLAGGRPGRHRVPRKRTRKNSR